MRSLVGIITTIATVIHFTFGCCLHPCHHGGCSEAASHAVEPVACETCCHDHDQDHDHDDAAIEPVGESCGRAAVVHVAATVPDHCPECDGCQGCHCVATSTEAGAALAWSPLASGIVATLDSHAIVLVAVACGRHPPDPHLHPSPGLHPLFERFLI